MIKKTEICCFLNLKCEYFLRRKRKKCHFNAIQLFSIPVLVDKGYLVLLAEPRVISCAAGYKHT